MSFPKKKAITLLVLVEQDPIQVPPPFKKKMFLCLLNICVYTCVYTCVHRIDTYKYYGSSTEVRGQPPVVSFSFHNRSQEFIQVLRLGSKQPYLLGLSPVVTFFSFKSFLFYSIHGGIGTFST